MKRLSILTFLALFAATLTQQGAARAQDTKAENWSQVPTVTSAWTHITEGSTKGFELKDDYYYVSKDLTFTNTNGGAGQGSGLYVQAGRTVRLYIPAGVTLTAIGANANGTKGAGAGILLPEGCTLHILGEGKLVAKGGNAADGDNGGNATKGEEDTQSVGTWFLGKKILGGLGGYGGNGGGGAGAGIGTAGANGGKGAEALPADSKERPQSYKDWTGGDLAGRKGDPGEAGATAAAMGTLYIQSTVTTDIQGGAKGNGGGAGKPGNVYRTGGEIEIKEIHWVKGIPIPVIDITDLQSIAGGGGGGGGAGGGSAQAIGTGGAGGGGGASGACGSGCAKSGWTNDKWGSVGAGGGEAGIGPENNNGTKGITCWFQGEDDDFADTDNHKPGGKGGSAGSASVAKSAGAAVVPSYTASFYTVGANPSKTEETYSVGSSTTITLPTLSGGSGNQRNWKWMLSIYGNVAGTTNGHCGGPNGDVYAPGSTVDLSNIYGAIEFCAVYVGCEIDCASKTNMYWKMGYAKFVANKYTVVDLKNRTLYKDGYWNTLTVPFSLSAEKLATTCLAGADIRVFKSASWDAAQKRLTINFSDSNEGKIQAGVPCIIRWGEPENAPGGTIENPSFTNVAVDLWDQEDFDEDEDPDSADKYETESGGLRFQAQIAPVQLSSNSKSLLLGGENNLYRPSSSIYVYATRAYFTYSKNSGIAMTRSVVIDFGDGDQKAINIDDSGVIDVEGILNQNAQRPDAPQK